MLVHETNNICLTDNIVETLNISSIKQSFDNNIYESSPQNSNFDY